jgi:hypothetical protein
MAESYVVPQSLIDTYAREGAVLIPQPFGAHWIDGMIERVERIVHDWEAGSQAFPVMRRNGAMGIQNVILRDPFFRSWATGSPVASIVAQVTGSRRVRFYFDNFFIKEGRGEENGTQLHHDVPAFGFQGAQLPSFWLALTDVDMDNAPLVTYAGSHGDCRHRFRSPAQKPGLPLLPGYREPREIPDYLAEGGYEKRIHVARKGDVVMVNPYTIHASLHQPADGQARLRIGFSSRWLGDDVTWQGSLYHEIEASTHPRPLTPGEAPPDDWFPVVWDRELGPVAEQTGRFTTHVTLEPRKGYHTTVEGERPKAS